MSHFDKLCSQAYTRVYQGCLTTSVLGTQGSSLGTGGSGGVLAGPPRKEPALQTNVVPFDDLTDEEFEEEYAAKPVARAEIFDDVTSFPTDRGLREG